MNGLEKGILGALALAFFALPAAAQDARLRGLQAAPDVYLYASPDPLMQAVFAGQIADPKNGGVVSAVRLADPKAETQPTIAYQGTGTPVAGIGLPRAAVPGGVRAVSAGSDLRDAAGSLRESSGPQSARVSPGARVVKRSIAADQLFDVVAEMQKAGETGSARTFEGSRRRPDEPKRDSRR